MRMMGRGEGELVTCSQLQWAASGQVLFEYLIASSMRSDTASTAAPVAHMTAHGCPASPTRAAACILPACRSYCFAVLSVCVCPCVCVFHVDAFARKGASPPLHPTCCGECNTGGDDALNGGIIGQVEEQHSALQRAILLKVLHTWGEEMGWDGQDRMDP